MVTLWGLTFHAYGLIVGMAVVLGWWNFERLVQRYHQPVFTFLEWCGLLLITLLGARAWHVVTDSHWYLAQLRAGEWWQVLAVWRGGLSILGGVAGAVAGIWILRRNNFFLWLDCLALTLPWSQAVGRWANWVNQELYGLPTTLPWGIRIATQPNELRFHPLFAYEMLSMLLLGLGLWHLHRKTFWKPGSSNIWWLYLSSYSVVRFCLDFLRLDRGPVWVGLGLNQWVLLGAVILGVVMLTKISLKQLVLPITLIVLCSVAFVLGKQFYVQKNLEYQLQQVPDLSEVKLRFAGIAAPLQVTLAKTENSQMQGLGDLPALTNDGMLFWFPHSDRWQFWMKGMQFGLDFIWLNNLTIVAINQNVPAPNTLNGDPFGTVLTSPVPVNLVLELPAGKASQLRLKVGQTLQLNTK